jgi:hypothetical protein
VDPGPGAAPGLAASLGARVHGDTVAFTLRVSNATNGPVRVEFASGQRYDFEVGTAAGTQLWKWSADRMFTQSVGSEQLEANGSMEYTEEWAGARKGEYVVRARLVSVNKPVDLRTRFVVP